METVAPKTLMDWILTGGATAVLSIVAYAFATGRIVARSIHDARVQELTNDRDHWRDAYQTLASPVERILIAAAGRHAGESSAETVDRPR